MPDSALVGRDRPRRMSRLVALGRRLHERGSCGHHRQDMPPHLAPDRLRGYADGMNTTTQLPVDGIEIGHLRRPISESQVADLMDSISRLGLLQPLVVTTSHRLVAGRHRLEAIKRLGWITVPAVVMEVSDLPARLATVDDNLLRNDLSRLERFEHIVLRAELISTLGQRKRVGRPRKADTVSAIIPKSTDDLAAASGLSGRTLQRACKILAAIPECVREKFRATPLADSTTELLRLSRLTLDDQMAVAERVVAGERGAVNDLILAVKRKRRAADATRQATLQRDDDAGVHVGRFEELCHVIPDDGVAAVGGDAAAGIPDPAPADEERSRPRTVFGD